MIIEAPWIQSAFTFFAGWDTALTFFAGWSAALVCVLIHTILTIREEKRR